MNPYRLLDLVLWVAAAACFYALMVTSLGPSPSILAAFPGADQLFHFIGYFFTTFFLLLAAAWHPWRARGPFARFAGWLVAGMILIGVGVEVGQLAAYQRTPDIIDAFANALGVGTAAVVWKALRAGTGVVAARRERKKSSPPLRPWKDLA